MKADKIDEVPKGEHPYKKAKDNIDIQLILYDNFRHRLRDAIDFIEDCKGIAKEVNDEKITGKTSADFEKIKQFLVDLDIKEFLGYLYEIISARRELKLNDDKWKEGRIYNLLKDWDGEPIENHVSTYCEYGSAELNQKIQDCFKNSLQRWTEERAKHDYDEYPQGDYSPTDPMTEEDYTFLHHKDQFGALSDREILFEENKRLKENIKRLRGETDYKRVQALEQTIENARKVAKSKGFEFEEVIFDEFEGLADYERPF